MFTTLRVIEPNEITTFSYLIIGSFDNKQEAQNLRAYLKTKFARFLVLQAISSINITKEKFQYLPIQDFSKELTDEELYKKYNLSSEEISHIEQLIKEFD